MEELDNSMALEDLQNRKANLEKQLELGKEMYLKITGAIEVLTQIEESKVKKDPEVKEE